MKPGEVVEGASALQEPDLGAEEGSEGAEEEKRISVGSISSFRVRNIVYFACCRLWQKEWVQLF
jgi:hypothetical protein